MKMTSKGKDGQQGGLEVTRMQEKKVTAHALLSGSVAIDVIPADMCEVDTDQRGVTRPQGAMCDVGAFELEE